MSEITFTIANGEEVTVFDSYIDFLESLLDMFMHNEKVTLESQKKGDVVYVTVR